MSSGSQALPYTIIEPTIACDEMAILQALLALITRSVGKILNAGFGWAVHALFGQTSTKDQTMLSVIVAAAVAWPLLALGVVAPKIAVRVLAFVPLPHSVPSWIVRVVWLVLAFAVPLALGITIAARGRVTGKPESVVKRLLRGFPLTIGLALAFLIMFISVPVLRLVAIARRRKTADIPLITDVAAYHQVAALVVTTLNTHGFGLRPAQPGWWVKAPTRVLAWFGGNAFDAMVPQNVEYYEAPGLSVSFYTSGVLLEGKGQKLTWAHGLIEEVVVHSDGLQTFSPPSQKIERELRRLWKTYDADREAHTSSSILLSRLAELTAELGDLDVAYDEWQVVYRQLIQLDRALRGERQLLEETGLEKKKELLQKGSPMSSSKDEATIARTLGTTNRIVAPAARSDTLPRTVRSPVEDPASLSTGELVSRAVEQVTELGRTQIQLAVAEARASLKSELGMAKGLGVAAWAGLSAVQLLLVAAAFGLAQVIPGWAAGLVVAGVLAVVAAIAGMVGWKKRVRTPMERTRRELKEDVKWAKETIA